MVVCFLRSCVLYFSTLVRVIHTLRNFLFKNQSRRRCKLIWAYYFVFLSVVKLRDKRLQQIARNHLQLQFIGKSSQENVKIQSKFGRLLLTFQSQGYLLFIIAHSPKGLQNSKLFVAQQKLSCSEKKKKYRLFHNRNLQFALILNTIYSTKLNCKRI